MDNHKPLSRMNKKELYQVVKTVLKHDELNYVFVLATDFTSMVEHTKDCESIIEARDKEIQDLQNEIMND